MINHGSFVISLDFELLWGGLDCWPVEGYGTTHVANVRDAIQGMTSLFEKYGVHATFATVGFLMLNDIDAIKRHQPKDVPTYKNDLLNPYGSILETVQEHTSMFFAPDVVEQLKTIPGIEIGTHTFCHYYCWEDGQRVEQFVADMTMANKVAEEKGLKLESIVFPRNQVSKEYLDVCAKQGILSYRGNSCKFFDFTTSRWKAIYNKISRLIDAYMNWGGFTSTPYSSIDCFERPVNIPASRMLRPYMKQLKLLEPLRLRRIKGEMLHAAKHHELYHLWWHPHNFGADPGENLAFLEEVLKCYQTCQQQYGMQSLTMKEMYSQLTQIERFD